MISNADLPVTRTAITSQQAAWLLGLLIAALVLPAFGGEAARQLLRYQREAVLGGEYWRLVTGHLVHGGTWHLLLNCAGLALMAALFRGCYPLKAWLFIGLASMLAIDLGFVFYEPQLHWYVGFSGVLHGVLAAGAIAWHRHEGRTLALALSVVLVGKLAWEQVQGALPLAGDLPVVVDAHLYGAIGGVLAAGVLWLRDEHWPFRRPSL